MLIFDKKSFLNWLHSSEHTSKRRDVETHTSYQHHNFHTTGVNALKP
jgi:hypothetical protein